MDAPNAPRIGPLMQQQRKARGLTLEQLAAISGVSRSMLSQIERGQANPTFAVLWGLTRALKIDFANLLQGAPGPIENEAIEVVAAAHTPEIRSPDGACRLRILSSPQLAGQSEWYDIEFAPGGALDSAPHTAGAFEHFTAFTAGLSVTSGGVTRALKTNETARYAADVPHRIANLGQKAARGLLVVLYR